MKTYDAVVTVKHRINLVVNEADLATGMKFDDLVRELIEAEGICEVAEDEFTIVSIEQKEHKET